MSTRIDIDDCLRRTKRFICVLHYATQATMWAALACICAIRFGNLTWTAHPPLSTFVCVLFGMALMGTACTVYLTSLETSIAESQRSGDVSRGVAKQKEE